MSISINLSNSKFISWRSKHFSQNEVSEIPMISSFGVHQTFGFWPFGGCQTWFWQFGLAFVKLEAHKTRLAYTKCQKVKSLVWAKPNHHAKMFGKCQKIYVWTIKTMCTCFCEKNFNKKFGLKMKVYGAKNISSKCLEDKKNGAGADLKMVKIYHDIIFSACTPRTYVMLLTFPYNFRMLFAFGKIIVMTFKLFQKFQLHLLEVNLFVFLFIINFVNLCFLKKF